MNDEKVVVSCPRCLRQYEAEASVSGKLGKCGKCKAHFSIAVTQYAASAPGAVVFENEVMPRHGLLLDGCATLAWNIRRLLKLAGEPVTPESVAEIAHTLPRCRSDLMREQWKKGLCNQTMEKAYCRHLDTTQGAGMLAVLEYFTNYIPDRSYDVIDMLSGAVVGVLSERKFDAPADAVTKKRRWRWRLPLIGKAVKR